MAKYQRYEEYRNSGVEWLGEIPKGWEITALKRYCNVKGGYAFASDAFTDVGKPIIRIGDIKEDGSINLDSCKLISNELAKSSNAYLVEKGQLLMAMTGATIGKAGVYISDSPAYLNQRVGKFVIDNDELNYGFLWYTLKTNGYQEYIKLTAFGGAQPNISDTGMVDYISCFPSLIEQTQIANFLDHETAQIDTLIEKQQTLIQLLKEKRQAVISHAVTKGLNPDAPMKDSGVEWLGEVPEHWTVSFVKYIVLGEKDSMVDGPFGSSVNTSEDYVDDGIPVIRTVNITNNGFSSDNLKFMRQQKFDQLKRHSVKPGDVLFSKVGTIGNACLLPSDIPEAILSTTGSCKISVDQNKIEGEYLVLMFHLMNQTLMEMANSNVQPFLNMSNIKNLKISLPSIEEQKNILTYLEEKLEGIDDLIAKSLSFDKLIRERRTALISAAVTGKIDVRGWRAPE